MNDDMSSEILTYSDSDGVAVITMDDGKANVLSPSMMEQLNGALDRAEKEAGAVLLVGRPNRFSAGFDLTTMMQGPAAARAMVKSGAELLMRMYELPLPTVLACTGHAIAGGAMLLFTGDTRIGTSGEFKLGYNEVANNMPVPIFAHELARDRLLPTELFAAVVHSRMYSPEQAVQIGWLDRVATPDTLLDEALAEAKLLAKLPRTPYVTSKRSLRHATVAHVRATLEANLTALLGPG